MITVEMDELAAALPAYLDKAAAGQSFLIASHHRPLAELHPPAPLDAPIDAQELERRRDLGRRIDELRAEIKRVTGVQPDSVELIREMRDNPRHDRTGD